MNKKLLTAVVATTLCASPAAVYAAASVYGSLDVGVQFVDPGGNYDGGKIFVEDKQGSGGSYLGWKASDDLGGGLKGIAQAELGMFTDEGVLDNTANKLFQRQIWAGLEGGFGKITAGRQYRELFLTGSTGTPAYTNGAVGAFFYVAPAGLGVRQDNYIKYVTPKFGGFDFAVGYSPGENANPANKNDQFYEASAKWAGGPFKAAVATGKTTVADFGTTTSILAGQWMIIPTVTVYGIYATGSNDDNSLDANGYGLGGKFTIGKGDILVQYAAITNNAVSQADSNLIGLAYYYHLSKTSYTYVTYGQVSNDPNASFVVPRQAVASGVSGDDPSFFAFGYRIFF